MRVVNSCSPFPTTCSGEYERGDTTALSASTPDDKYAPTHSCIVAGQGLRAMYLIWSKQLHNLTAVHWIALSKLGARVANFRQPELRHGEAKTLAFRVT